MSVVRRVAMAAGLLVGGIGVTLALRPDLAGRPSVGRVAVTVLGGGSLAWAGYVLVDRFRNEQRWLTPPEPESFPSRPVPGDDLDELLARPAGSRQRRLRNQRRRRRRLEAAAVAAVARRDGCSTDAARERLEDGTWTDDPLAASYFTSEGLAAAEEDLSPVQRARALSSSGYASLLAARRVVTVIAEMGEELHGGDRRTDRNGDAASAGTEASDRSDPAGGDRQASAGGDGV